MGIGKNNSPQNPTVRIKNVAQPVGQVQAGPSTNPSAGYVMEASTPPMTTPLTSNSNPVNTISPTYGNKDNRLSSVKNNNLSSIGNITTQPNNLTNIGLQPQQEITEVNTQPTLQDFIAEAQKLGQEQVIANIDPNFANDLARQLYGQNVGMSGLGTGVVSNALDKSLAPIAKQVGIQTAQQELEYRQQDAKQKADTLFGLVESGQLTGKQAEQALINQGIDPKSYMTPEQVVQKQQQEELDTYLAQIDDPIERDLIDSVEEFKHYMEFGRTYEDELSDILTTKKSLREWKALFPTLKESISRLEGQIMSESQKSSNWLPWDKPDGGRIDTWNAQLNALKEIIADVESGKDPVYDIAEYGG